MAAHASTNETIKNPGHYVVSSSTKGLFGIFILIGAAAFAYGLSHDSKRAWAAFVQNHFYFLSLGLGGLFFAAIQWLTSAMWSAPLRRVAESFTAYLPIALVTFVVLYFGMNHLYIWTNPETVKASILLEAKASYLSVGFFFVRNIIAILLWIFFATRMIGNSLKQDHTRDHALSLKNQAMAPGFLFFFGVSFTMAAFDLLMSLDPYWYSTMFGVYCFAGLFYSTLALTAIIAVVLRNKGVLEGIVKDDHLHDLGKFMFAFTVFWAYIGFSQYMLIWYANMPEETGYFIHRLHGGWFYVSVFLLVGKFMTPFFLLLRRDSKRNGNRLIGVGAFMLVAQWIDILWLVQPEVFKEGPQVGFIEIGLAFGFAGLFGTAVSRFMGRNNIVAIGDPRLVESVYHHHQ